MCALGSAKLKFSETFIWHRTFLAFYLHVQAIRADTPSIDTGQLAEGIRCSAALYKYICIPNLYIDSRSRSAWLKTALFYHTTSTVHH